MIYTDCVDTLIKIADKAIDTLDKCIDMPEKMHLEKTLESIEGVPIESILIETNQFIKDFDVEIRGKLLTNDSELRKAYSLWLAEQLKTKFWPVYRLTEMLEDSTLNATYAFNFKEIEGVPTVEPVPRTAKELTTLHENQQTGRVVFMLFSGCIGIAVNYIHLLNPQIIETYQEELGSFLKERHKQINQPDETVEVDASVKDGTLSAPQKLLFIRLLQQSSLFPIKPNNTDDSPELRAIAMLTGLDYKNDLKGGNGAVMKVNQLLNSPNSLTKQQIPQKLFDLDTVEKVAELLNLSTVISSIQTIRNTLQRKRGF